MRRIPVIRLAASERGAALIEFSIVLPVLLLLIFVGFELSNAIACNRKVTITARAAADLVSQYALASPSMLDSILGASTQIMAPFSASGALVRVSEITTDQLGNATVTWSRAINGTRYTPGTSYALPAAMVAPNVSYIVSDVNYAYVPTVGFGFVRPFNLNQTITMLPRVSSSISCDACT